MHFITQYSCAGDCIVISRYHIGRTADHYSVCGLSVIRVSSRPCFGHVLSGLLAGILISRSVSGLIGSVMDWHFVYLIAAIACTILFFVLQAYLPRDVRGHQDIRYKDILASLPRIFRSEKYLQGAAINGFCLFGLSNVLWSTLAFYLADQYHLGSGVAGLLGLLGITGVLFASIIGRIVDTYSPRLTIGLGILFSAVAS